ncbi:single-stranded-DNA-specific exonuclease RecJ [Gangjinia marincola]|uniref:Single-stranded-DNA-specific exonuclease RecJ n=1 Tax=Gangjinia marincola TaxID=578463 RepID=A0ABN1MI60_9FLAO
MRWTIKPVPALEKIKHLQDALQVDAVTAQLLIQRGIKTYDDAKAFFRPSISQLHDPFLMKDMDRAVDRIEKAIKSGENILIYGDYDVDGTTAVSLMYSFLSKIHSSVATYIPDRYEEGYGISYQGIDFAQDNGFTLIIALDCGIKAIDKVAYAEEKQIDFIICDHHRPGEHLPKAVAVLDPKRKDCTYPYEELCGCGVGFKLIQALAQHQDVPVEALTEYLDLVATAIGADIVPITGENRILAYHGLEVINKNPRPGIAAMTAPLKKELTITDVVFIIAPRINAAGRIKHGQNAVNLLTENDPNVAIAFAEEIETFNLDRRSLDKQITAEALAQITTLKEEDRMTSVVYDKSWHKGVIGIVASRLIETYYRPTLVFTKSGNKLAASARSVRGYDVYEALEACQEHIEQFGGHKYAAGLTLAEANYGAFKQKFEEVVSGNIDPKLLVPEISIDAEIKLRDLTPKFYRILKQFAPFGPGNMRPTFMVSKAQDTGYGKTVGQTNDHLKLTLTQDKVRIGAIGFNLGDKEDLIKDKQCFSAAFTLDENEWNGNVTLQLKLKDIKPN